jgi:hypothetical protein
MYQNSDTTLAAPRVCAPRVIRRHVDLLRVNSALCPSGPRAGTTAGAGRDGRRAAHRPPSVP